MPNTNLTPPSPAELIALIGRMRNEASRAANWEYQRDLSAGADALEAALAKLSAAETLVNDADADCLMDEEDPDVILRQIVRRLKALLATPAPDTNGEARCGYLKQCVKLEGHASEHWALPPAQPDAAPEPYTPHSWKCDCHHGYERRIRDLEHENAQAYRDHDAAVAALRKAEHERTEALDQVASLRAAIYKALGSPAMMGAEDIETLAAAYDATATGHVARMEEALRESKKAVRSLKGLIEIDPIGDIGAIAQCDTLLTQIAAALSESRK